MKMRKITKLIPKTPIAIKSIYLIFWIYIIFIPIFHFTCIFMYTEDNERLCFSVQSIAMMVGRPHRCKVWALISVLRPLGPTHQTVSHNRIFVLLSNASHSTPFYFTSDEQTHSRSLLLISLLFHFFFCLAI